MKKIVVIKKAAPNAKPSSWCPWFMDDGPQK
jgi:hypothetical protein